MGEANGDQVYLALSLFATFISFIIVSLCETIGYIFYLNGDRDFYVFWVEFIGVYGSCVLYFIPVMFAIMQMLIQLGGSL